MEQKNSQTFKIDRQFHKDIVSFTKLNNIDDVDVFLNKCFKKGFDIERFGLLGSDIEIKEVEKIVEIIKEVPVEKVVEVIKEIQLPPKEIEVIKYVDREVKVEIPVEKIVYIYDKKEDEVVTNLDNICDKPEPIIIEKIVEVIKEVPVEKIVTVYESSEPQIIEKEVIKEIIKEIPVTVSDEKTKMLQETLLKQKKDLSLKENKINELEEKIKNLELIKINQGALYLRGSNTKENL